MFWQFYWNVFHLHGLACSQILEDKYVGEIAYQGKYSTAFVKLPIHQLEYNQNIDGYIDVPTTAGKFGRITIIF